MKGLDIKLEKERRRHTEKNNWCIPSWLTSGLVNPRK